MSPDPTGPSQSRSLCASPRAEALVAAARGYLPVDWRYPTTRARVPMDVHDTLGALLPVRARGQRTEYSCGAAALATLMSAYGFDLEDDTAERLTGTTPIGVDGVDLVAAVRSLGFEADARYGARVEDIDVALASGDPVMIDFWASFAPDDDPHEDMGHYAVVVASDERDYLVIDPYSINAAHVRLIPRGELARVWWDTDIRSGERFEHWMMTIRLRASPATPRPAR